MRIGYLKGFSRIRDSETQRMDKMFKAATNTNTIFLSRAPTISIHRQALFCIAKEKGYTNRARKIKNKRKCPIDSGYRD